MDKPTGQTWLPVPGWEGLYEVSDLGLLWSRQRRPGTQGGMLLKTPIDSRGYRQVNLCRDGKPFHTLVHILVATAFHGPRPAGMECRHLDGDRANCAAANLMWGTSSENQFDRVRHGTFRNVNTGKTHCNHGHEFTPENTIWRTRKEGGRACRACKRLQHEKLAAQRLAWRTAARLAARP